MTLQLLFWIIVVAGIFITVFVGLLRWIFRIDTIVDLLQKILKELQEEKAAED